MKKLVLAGYALLIVLIVLCIPISVLAQKKILHIDSYSPSYKWSAGIATGIQSVLKDHEDIKLKVFYMDTKRHQSEEYKKNIASKASTLIATWRPDLIIASDDNASKYVIAPWFKNSDIPIVFCGLNWDASEYGFPTSNITGMIEVSLVKPLLSTLKDFSTGNRIGFLASDTLSERKIHDNITKQLGVSFNTRFVRTFTELKQAFITLQQETDMILLTECRSVIGFNHREMVEFMEAHTQIPTGATHTFLNRYVLITYANVAEEQGQFAARAALEILGGKSPADIPVTYNKKARIYLNMKIAHTLGIKFPMSLLENAHLISAINNYLLPEHESADVPLHH